MHVLPEYSLLFSKEAWHKKYRVKKKTVEWIQSNSNSCMKYVNVFFYMKFP